MQFRAGDVVHLIAYPSHRMTVVEVDGCEITCRWFEGAAVKEGIFPLHIIAKEVSASDTYRFCLGATHNPYLSRRQE
jgi:uncharacterized protein YodC (DUF2158 family)